ncbi:hypothetical protein CHARACLAT_033068 [Characodon lateralis]|uniref:Uncharacterized protein n=1 Tax=Characodon lateralis TaxID=208331 RepID=A0ABU7DW81_9TELE|nr:hypothetical protein [Characodon lateralis]
MQYREEGRMAVCYEAVIQNQLRVQKHTSTQRRSDPLPKASLKHKYSFFSPHSKLFLKWSAMLEPQCPSFASLPSELEAFVNGQRLKRAPLRLMSVCSLLNTPVKSKGRETS